MYLNDAPAPNAFESALAPLLNLYQQKELIKAQADLVRARGTATMPVMAQQPAAALPYVTAGQAPLSYDAQRIPVPQRNTTLIVGAVAAVVLVGFMIFGGRGRRR